MKKIIVWLKHCNVVIVVNFVIFIQTVLSFVLSKKTMFVCFCFIFCLWTSTHVNIHTRVFKHFLELLLVNVIDGWPLFWGHSLIVASIASTLIILESNHQKFNYKKYVFWAFAHLLFWFQSKEIPQSVYSSKHDNFVVLGDWNREVSNSFMEQFCASYNLITPLKNLHTSKVLVIHLA